MPDAHGAPPSTSEQPTSERPSEPISPVPAGHPGIALLIMRARRRRSRETAELLAGVDFRRDPKTGPDD
ncbi:MAG TPA: hypothetical protein VH112_08075 [Acidimicrobiales bacterium]|nr:hypothetical protein [Acidimicrobiales bacterium]